ncbi:hypothetical protein EHS16_01855, partial [Streptococcus anginosus]
MHANKKYITFIKNTIKHAIINSVTEYTSVKKYLKKIKNQFTDSSKLYTTQLLKQLITKKYTEKKHNIKKHILKINNITSKLKPININLKIKPAILIHLIITS